MSESAWSFSGVHYSPENCPVCNPGIQAMSKTARDVIAMCFDNTVEGGMSRGYALSCAAALVEELDAAGFVIVPKEPTEQMTDVSAMGNVVPGPGSGSEAARVAAAACAAEPGWLERATELCDALPLVAGIDAPLRAQIISAVASSLRRAYYDGCSQAAKESQKIFQDAVIAQVKSILGGG